MPERVKSFIAWTTLAVVFFFILYGIAAYAGEAWESTTTIILED